MTVHGSPDGEVSALRIWEIEPVLRRVVAARVRDPAAVEDLVQDALEHLLVARGRLMEEMIVPYGVVTARNLAISHGRRNARAQAVRARIVDVERPEEPHEALLRQEERNAITTALARLPDGERHSLLEHDLGWPATEDLDETVSPGTTRVRLARSRAKLRVEYLLSFRRVELPTPRCRPTLIVLAGGDRARQRSGSTGRHLLDCDTCASLSEALVGRTRGMAALLPLVALRWAARTARSQPAATAGATALAAAAVAAGLTVSHGSPAVRAAGVTNHAAIAPPAFRTEPTSIPTGAPPTVRSTSTNSTGGTVPPPASLPVPGLTVAGAPVSAGSAPMTSQVGRNVDAREVVVQSTVTHNGFWVGSDAVHRVWVDLVGPLRPLQVRAGDRVTFSAPMVGQDSSYATLTGVGKAGGALELETQGAHLNVVTTGIVVSP
jgi:RNA polymerase sigma factor (sigma-70 family)